MRRKLAVILSSDVAGYSRLVALDEETTIARFAKLKTSLMELVVAFHGRIFNTAGDAILAEFASATDAVRCAIEFQDTVRARNLAFPESQKMLFRIGIAIGDVLVQEDGDLLGDGVNIAARLQTLAEPGGICISSDVHGYVDRNLSCQVADLGPQELKNLTRPVRAYALSLFGSNGAPSPQAADSNGQNVPLVAEARSFRRRGGKRMPVLAVSIAVLALLLVGGWWYVGRKPAPKSTEIARQNPIPPTTPARPQNTAPAGQQASTPKPPETTEAPKPPEPLKQAEPATDTPPAPSVEQAKLDNFAAEVEKLALPPSAGDTSLIATGYLAQEAYKALAAAPGAGVWRSRRAVSEHDAETLALNPAS